MEIRREVITSINVRSMREITKREQLTTYMKRKLGRSMSARNQDT